MNALRKHTTVSSDRKIAAGSVRVPAPEAYAYEDDVTPEAIEKLRREVAPIISKGDWEVIEGYVGQKPCVGK